MNRQSLIPLALVGLLAGGALVPHLVPPTTGQAPAANQRPPVAPVPALGVDEGSAPFVQLLAQLLSVDITDAGLIEYANSRLSKRDGADRADRLEFAQIARGLADFDPDRAVYDAELEDTMRTLWPCCSGGRDPAHVAAPRDPGQRKIRESLPRETTDMQ